MLDLFSESARRIIFWARYEAGRLRYDTIEAHHLLLGFLQEDQDAPLRFAALGDTWTQRGANIETREEPFLTPAAAANLSTAFSTLGPLSMSAENSVDMPLSDQSRAALQAATNLANGSTIRFLHILWGVLAAVEAGPLPESLAANGITRQSIEAALRQRAS